MSASTVVPAMQPLDEDEFHAEFMVLLARLNRRHGPAKLAQALGYTTKRQLQNLAHGSLPHLRGYYNLLALDRTAHDELDARYGQRKVPADALCSSDPVAAKMAALLTQAIEAESPDSPGGRDVVLHEVLAMAATAEGEATLREVERTVRHWIEMLDTARRPAGLKAVQS